MAIWEEFNNIDTRDYATQHPALFAYVKEAMAAPGKQYLLIGDSNHGDDELKKFKSSPALAALFKQAAVAHVCVEVPRELAPPARMGAYRAQLGSASETLDKTEAAFWRDFEFAWRDWAARYGKDGDGDVLRQLNRNIGIITDMVKRKRISAEEGQRKLDRLDNEAIAFNRSYWGPRLLGFVHAGLRVTAADSWQWKSALVHGDGERIFLGDREVAGYIDSQARGQKTAVIYGAGHFQYDGTLAARLGREKCVHIDIYADRSEYQRRLGVAKTYADILPDKVYLLKEQALEDPDPALYRAARKRTDDMAQRDKDDVVRRYGPDARPAAKTAAVARLVKVPGTDPQYFDYVP